MNIYATMAQDVLQYPESQWEQQVERLRILHKLSPSDIDRLTGLLNGIKLRRNMLGREVATDHTNDVATEEELAPGYRRLGELGRGGTGVVYKALQRKLNRVVALKIILAPGQSDLAKRTNSKAEAVAIASLQHPNIVHVYEVGEIGSHPYLSLEFINGPTLYHRLAGNPQPTYVAVQLVEVLARAVQYAHERGVVHNDLKPSNVLLMPSERTEAFKVGDMAEGATRFEPKITDFGLAGKMGDAAKTANGAAPGTPSYMAPEQASDKPGRTGPSIDVYALGAILYECLTGRPPFKGGSPGETIEQVRTQEPVAPHRLRPSVPRDLETICLTCLHKDPLRRYRTALELADDLERFRTNQPILARPYSRPERLVMLVRRHPKTTLQVVSGSLVIGLGLALWSTFAYYRYSDQLAVAKQATETAHEESERIHYFHRVVLAGRELSSNNVLRTGQLLRECPEERRDWEWHYINRLSHQEWHRLAGHHADVNCVAFAPDGKSLASGSDDATVMLWDVKTGEGNCVLKGHTMPVAGVAFGPDGSWLASSGGDSDDPNKPGEVIVWDARTNRKAFDLSGFIGAIYSLAFSLDGRFLAAAGGQYDEEGEIQIYEVNTQRKIRSLKGHTREVISVAFSPDGKTLASASGKSGMFFAGSEGKPGEIILWDLATGERTRTLRGHKNLITSVAFRPNGSVLATSSWDGTVKLWDMTAPRAESLESSAVCLGLLIASPLLGIYSLGIDPKLLWPDKPLQTIYAQSKGVTCVCFSPDGRSIVTSSSDGTVRVWDIRTEKLSRTFLGHDKIVSQAAFSPNGKVVASASDDWTVRVWRNLVPGEDEPDVFDHEKPVYGIAFSADGQSIASACGDTVARVWDRQTKQSMSLRGHQLPVTSIAFSPDGRRLASSSGDVAAPERIGEIILWDRKTGKRLCDLQGHTAGISRIVFSPDGKHLASASEDATVRIWNADDGREERSLVGHSYCVWWVAFSHKGDRVASASKDGTVKIWDVTTGRQLSQLGNQRSHIYRLAFSPDDKSLAWAGFDGVIRIWDVWSNRERAQLVGHDHIEPVSGLAFRGDGRRLASACIDGSVKIWDVETCQEALGLPGHANGVFAVEFSPDGQVLATAGGDGKVRIWDGRPLDGN